MLEYITRDFNDGIKEVHIRSKGNVYEKDICIIMNPRTDDQILWIKFLKEEITDDMWKQLKESHAGTDSGHNGLGNSKIEIRRRSVLSAWNYLTGSSKKNFDNMYSASSGLH